MDKPEYTQYLHERLEKLTGRKIVYVEAKKALNEKKKIQFDKRFETTLVQELSDRLGEGAQLAPYYKEQFITYTPSNVTGNKPHLGLFWQGIVIWPDKDSVLVRISLYHRGSKGQEASLLTYDVEGKNDEKIGPAEGMLLNKMIPLFKQLAQAELKQAVAQKEKFFDDKYTDEWNPEDVAVLDKYVQSIASIKPQKG